MKSSFKLSGKVWLYPREAFRPSSGQAGSWHFVTIEQADAQEIKKEYIWPRRGFGAIPVMVKIGKTKWKTSIFPDKQKTYLLPLKKEGIEFKEGKVNLKLSR